MSIHDDFINKVISHPEWEVIRSELCKDVPEPTVIELGGGASVWIGGDDGYTEEDRQNSDIWGEICWHVNSGPGYCEIAPTHIKVYLRRLGAI